MSCESRGLRPVKMSLPVWAGYAVKPYIKEKLLTWVDSVERMGINIIRKVPGYHDELLKGKRKGQRSIRLNKAYRAIYIENEQKEIIIISIIG